MHFSPIFFSAEHDSPAPRQEKRGQPYRTLHKCLGVATLMFATFTAGIHYANAASSEVIHAIGVENEYADVISQVGGKYVDVTALLSNPDTDPHSFAASPSVARNMAQAQLIVQNGAGYDDWADKLINATPNTERKVLNVQHLRGLPDDTWNPHLWYDVKTMPVVADAIADALSSLRPNETKEFKANAEKFKQSLTPWHEAIANFKRDFPNTPLAVTEPVSDYLLQALGANVQTPKDLQTATMNGTDPSPQDVNTQMNLFKNHQIKAFVYNQQVTNSLTSSFLAAARKNSIPVVSVYETMPAGFHYQSWMLAETNALRKALEHQISTEQLQVDHP